MKNREKTVLKNMCFFNIDFLAFFCIFAILHGFWEAPGAPKIDEKSKKTLLEGISNF